MNEVGLDAAQQPIAVQGQIADASVDLVVPIGKTGGFREILGLNDVMAACAAAVDFLKTNDIERLEKMSDSNQIRKSLLRGPDVPPASGDIVPITGRCDARLNIETCESDTPLVNRRGSLQRTRNSPRCHDSTK